MPSSSGESWIEGIGGPEEINQEISKYVNYYITAFRLPQDPRALEPSEYQIVMADNNLKCCYKILHPEYNIITRRNGSNNTNCTQFRKKVKFTIGYIYQLSEVFTGFTNNDFHGHLLDNTELLRLTDIGTFNDENRKNELYILAFNLEYRYLYLETIPEVSRNSLEQINNRIQEINNLLQNISFNEKIINNMILLYFINCLIDNHTVVRITSELFLLMSNILDKRKEEVDRLLQTQITQRERDLIINLKIKILELSSSLIIAAREIYARLSPDESMKSSFKDISSHEYSSSSFKETKFNIDNISDKCKLIFKDIDNSFNGNKMKVICHKLTHPKHCRDINKIRGNIFEYYSKQYPKIVDDVVSIEVDTENIIQSVFRAWINFDSEYNHNESLFERSIFYESGFNIRQKGFGGIGEGTARNTFTLLAKALKTQNVFIPIDENSKRYMINYNYNVNIGIDTIPYGVSEKSVKLFFWNFIGEFLQFCLVNNITLDFYLSYNLLYVFLIYDEDKIKKENLITYYLLSNNTTETKFMIESLRNPENIEEYFDKFNSYKKIVVKDKGITKKNFLQYLEMKAYYELNNQAFRKNYIFSDVLTELIHGFQILKFTKMHRILAKNKVNVQSLDRLLSESNVTIDNLKNFTTSILYIIPQEGSPLLQCNTGMKFNIKYDSAGTKTEVPNPLYNPNHEKIFENLKRIINNGLRTFPLDIDTGKSSSASEESSKTKKNRSEEYLKFMKKLFHFWSGSSSIGFMPPMPYRIAIINRANSFPSSHTCFYTIDIPDDLTSYKQLYQKLVIAVNNVEEELGLL